MDTENGIGHERSVEIETQELLYKREPLLKQLQEIESGLAKVKNEIRGHGGKRMENKEYARLTTMQARYVARKTEIMPQIQQIKSRLRDLGNTKRIEFEKQFLERSVEDSSPVVQELTILRTEYQTFSADPTRVGSMRRMAAEFALRLDRIIQRAVRSGITKTERIRAEEENNK